MNFELKINMGKPDWDKPEIIYTHDIEADSWEEAEAQAARALCYDDETFMEALRDQLEYNHAINPDYVPLSAPRLPAQRELIWQALACETYWRTHACWWRQDRRCSGRVQQAVRHFG